jgi:hypothetical protein
MHAIVSKAEAVGMHGGQTSGLDSSSSMEVCQALHQIATGLQVLVAAVIHQPRFEIFQLFGMVRPCCNSLRALGPR